MPDGMVPVRLLSPSSRTLSVVRVVNEVGSVPDKLLLDNFS